MKPVVSVVITAHNAAATIEASLAALRAQQGMRPGETEIVLIDDRSSDHTAEAARSKVADGLLVLRLVQYVDRSLTARQLALDLGFRHARGEVVLVLDADAIAAPDWIVSMSAPVLDGRADVVAGGVAFEPAADDWWSRAVASLQTVDAAYYLQVCRVLNAAAAPSGLLFGSAAFRRTMYDRVGGFGNLGHALTEDLAFARGVAASGGRILFQPQARVRVGACRTFGEVVRRAVRTSSGGASLLAAVLGTWMLALPLSLLAAVTLGGVAWSVLAARVGLGMFFSLGAVHASGEIRRMSWALIYEPVSILLGVGALVAVLRTREVEWGGVRYDRHRRPPAAA
jgi:cellulose synthase/poly-beta-1,6-N-acetylglucosamine synthase-like glycosyltransferase